MTGHGIVNGQVQVGLQLKEGANTTKITTLNNAGTINADKFAVVNSGIQNKAVIETLNNSGTIHSKVALLLLYIMAMMAMVMALVLIVSVL